MADSRETFFIGRPKDRECRIPYEAHAPPSNPVLRGFPLAVAASLYVHSSSPPLAEDPVAWVDYERIGLLMSIVDRSILQYLQLPFPPTLLLVQRGVRIDQKPVAAEGRRAQIRFDCDSLPRGSFGQHQRGQQGKLQPFDSLALPSLPPRRGLRLQSPAQTHLRFGIGVP